MARAPRQEEPENHERWLVSYADFITLLFAFFVVMFATSQADKGKAQQVSDSVKEAFEGKSVSAVIAAVLGGSPDAKGQGSAQMKGPGGAQQLSVKKDEKLAELIPSLRILSKDLKAEIDSGKIRIRMEARGLVISFTQAALFPSGEDVVSRSAFASLQKVAAAMAKIPNPARLEGHTDSQPIRNSRFRSNWELSAARSIALLEILSTTFDAPRDRISIAGYADTAPVAANDTEAGRARNRRVDIIILNERGVLAEPTKTAVAAAPSPGASR